VRASIIIAIADRIATAVYIINVLRRRFEFAADVRSGTMNL